MNRRPNRPEQGFTLLELLVVVAILVAVAAIGTANLYGTVDESKVSVARTEMQQIATALRQFRQDTGYYPGQGPYRLEADGGEVPEGSLPTVAGSNTAERRAWLQSPANLWPLYANPLAGTGHLLETWNPATGRGWRGPYLQRGGEGWVDLSSDLQADGSGDPLETGGAHRVRVPGAADPFAFTDAQTGALAVATAFDADGLLLDWRSVADALPGSPHYLGVIGLPYLALDLADPARARVLSLGPDASFGGVHASDPCVRADADDLILCLE